MTERKRYRIQRGLVATGDEAAATIYSSWRLGAVCDRAPVSAAVMPSKVTATTGMTRGGPNDLRGNFSHGVVTRRRSSPVGGCNIAGAGTRTGSSCPSEHGDLASPMSRDDHGTMPTYFVDDGETFLAPPSSSSASMTILSEALSGTELAQLAGLPPDEHWNRRDRPNAPGRFGGFRVRSRLPEAASPAEHLGDLLDRLEPFADSIRALASDSRVHSVRVWIFHRIPNWNPGLSFSPELIDRLGKLGTGVEVDVYVTNPSAPIRGGVALD